MPLLPSAHAGRLGVASLVALIAGAGCDRVNESSAEAAPKNKAAEPSRPASGAPKTVNAPEPNAAPDSRSAEAVPSAVDQQSAADPGKGRYGAEVPAPLEGWYSIPSDLPFMFAGLKFGESGLQLRTVCLMETTPPDNPRLEERTHLYSATTGVGHAAWRSATEFDVKIEAVAGNQAGVVTSRHEDGGVGLYKHIIDCELRLPTGLYTLEVLHASDNPLRPDAIRIRPPSGEAFALAVSEAPPDFARAKALIRGLPPRSP